MAKTGTPQPQTLIWLQKGSDMEKISISSEARLVKQANGEWYIVWYNNEKPRKRYIRKFNLNRIKNLEVRQQWANKILERINKAALTGDIFKPKEVSIQEAENIGVTSLPFLLHAEWFIKSRNFKPSTKFYRTCINNLKAFAKEKLGKESIDFEDFNNDFPMIFTKWCYARQHSQNYLSKAFKVIRQFLKSADENGLDTGTVWKTRKYMVKETTPDKISLSFEDVEKLYNVSLPTHLIPTREVFVFACLTGLRFSDVTRVNKTHIIDIKGKDKEIVKAVKIDTMKTGERVIVPLHRIALEILERNEGSLPKANCNQVFNRYIKDVAEMAGFTENVSQRINVGGKQKIDVQPKFKLIASHTARRTFATYAYITLSMPASLIMKITGHKTEREFFKYIRISQEKAALEMVKYFT